VAIIYQRDAENYSGIFGSGGYRVASKVLTPERVGKEGLEKVVDSKRMTLAKERNANE